MKTRTVLTLALAPGLVACANLAPAPEALAPVAIAKPVPPGMQWLYGSGESAASSIQVLRAFSDYVLAAAIRRPERSVVLSATDTLAAPEYMSCGRKPLAVILDVDETVIQNLGYEYDEARTGRGFDSAIWGRWERTGADKVLPVPGAVTALQAIRRAGVTVIFNSNRNAASADQTEAAIVGAGLGPAKHGETLFLSGDDATGSAKDGRRALIASRHCVVAMAGDQLGDFSDLFSARTPWASPNVAGWRAAAQPPPCGARDGSCFPIRSTARAFAAASTMSFPRTGAGAIPGVRTEAWA